MSHNTDLIESLPLPLGLSYHRTNRGKDQLRKTRSRIQKGEKGLVSDYIEVTTTVSAADMIIKGQFALYTGEALKREEVSSIRVNPKEEEGQS